MTLKLKSKPARKIGAWAIKKMAKNSLGIDVDVILNDIELKTIDGHTTLHLDVDMESEDCLSTIIKKLDC